MVEIVALARALAHSRKHRIAAVRLGDVVDELLNDDGFADAGASEQANLAAACIGRQQIDDLDPGDQNLGLGRLIGVKRSRLVNGAPLGRLHGACLVDRLADDVDDASERGVAHRHGDRLAGVDDLLAAHQALGDIHGDRPNRGFAEMLRHFQHQPVALVLGLERVQDRRQVIGKLHVNHGADHLRNSSRFVGHCVPRSESLLKALQRRK